MTTAEIKALAAAIVDEQERRDSIRKDAQYMASLDLDELKRRNHLKLIQSRRRAKQ